MKQIILLLVLHISTLIVVAQEEPCGRYIGNVGNNHIEMTLNMVYPAHQGWMENQNFYYKGQYKYIKIGAYISLQSHYLNNAQSYKITEYVNGRVTGYFIFKPFGCGDKFVSGTWVSPDGTRKYPVSLTRSGDE